jgi:thiazole synthase
LEATVKLVAEGFIVLPYTNDDLVLAKRLIDAGAATVMPLAAPIGSGLGIQNRLGLELFIEAIREYKADMPIIVDAGVGTASDAAIAMELGADGILMNTGIAGAKYPVGMAKAMRLALEAGRLAYLSGRIPRKRYATASSPIDGVVR